ncbi:MAG: hypothetical protein JSS35_01310 [Proteobacteria bacterium]|nr:hypothetical protein [Pseudomonadota bacterium]
MKALQLAGAAAILLAATAARAKETEPASAAKAAPTVSGVTVRAPEKANPLVDPTTQYVKRSLPEGQSDQLSRFRDEVCVKVQGLPAEFDAFIAKRLVAVAGEVGAPLAKAADCTPNVNVVFTTAPQALISDIAKRKDILIGFHYVAQLKQVTTFQGPIQAWYVTRTRDASGNSWIEVNFQCPYDPNGMVPCGERPIGRAGSRLGNEMSAEIVHSLVIADANKVAGRKIETVADYVAVLALARWKKVERCAPIATVLNAMAGDCPDAPQAATLQDIALLKGLYAVDPYEFGFQQRATIASAVRKASKDAEAAH